MSLIIISPPDCFTEIAPEPVSYRILHPLKLFTDITAEVVSFTLF
jgi:hypothetical protein